MSDLLRLPSSHTDVRYDDYDALPGHVALVLHGVEYGVPGSVVLHGTPDSLLMLVDRINDRVHALREGPTP